MSLYNIKCSLVAVALSNVGIDISICSLLFRKYASLHVYETMCSIANTCSCPKFSNTRLFKPPSWHHSLLNIHTCLSRENTHFTCESKIENTSFSYHDGNISVSKGVCGVCRGRCAGEIAKKYQIIASIE